MGELPVQILVWKFWSDWRLLRAFYSRGQARAIASIGNRYCSKSGFKEFDVVEVGFSRA